MASILDPRGEQQWEEVRAFLGSVFDLSEFMRDSARRQPEALERLFDTSVAKRLAETPWPVKPMA